MTAIKPNAVEKFLDNNKNSSFIACSGLIRPVNDVSKLMHSIETIVGMYPAVRYEIVNDEMQVDTESPMFLVEEYEGQYKDLYKSAACKSLTLVLTYDREGLDWHSTHVVINGSVASALLCAISDLYFLDELPSKTKNRLEHLDITPTSSRLKALVARSRKSKNMAVDSSKVSSTVRMVETPRHVLDLYELWKSTHEVGINSVYKYAVMKTYHDLYGNDACSLLCTTLLDVNEPFNLLYYLETYENNGEGFDNYLKQHKAYFKNRQDYAQLFTTALRHNEGKSLSVQYSVVNTVPAYGKTSRCKYVSLDIGENCVSQVSRYPHPDGYEITTVQMNNRFIPEADVFVAKLQENIQKTLESY